MTLPSDAPAVRDLSAVSNADFEEGCLLEDQNRAAIDLTGSSLRMQVRANADNTLLIDLLSTGLTSNGSGLVITSATEGAFNLIIKKEDIASLAFGSGTSIGAAYDLLMTNPAGSTIRLAKGNFFISKGITL
jgi:hypothetical protein